MELSSASPVPTNSHGLQDVENESKHDYIVDHDTAEINHNQPPDMNSVSSSFEDPLKLSTNLEYLTSSTEEDENKSSFTNEKLANDSSLILNEAVNVHTVVSCLPNESLGIILGMNERIEFEEGEKREVYMKKIVPNGAVHRVVLESQSFTLGDEILAINGAYFEKMTRSECIKLLTNLPSEVSFISRRNPMPWTAGPRCSFYLNLIDNKRESILSPAPKLFTNEGKKIPDNYKLLEISLYREIGDQLGISLVPSYGDTNHYYQIKSLDPEGLCSKSKLLNQGDCLVSCNGNSLYKIPFNQCLNIINSEGPSLTFEILRKDAIAVDENIESETNINQETKVNNNNSNNTWNPEIELENRNIKDKPKEFDENEDLLISFKDLSTEDSVISLDSLNNVTSEVALLQESTSSSYTEQNLTSETVPEESTTEALCLDPIGTLNLSSETQDITEVNLGDSKDKSLTKGVVEDKCVQQDVVSEHSSVPNNSAGQRNMSEYRNSKQEFSLNESDDSLISNELNNNFSIICPCYSNEDLISLGLDSPPPHKADLTFQSTIVAPREAAGESKSDLDDIDINPFLDQQDNYRSEHNLNNFNTNRTGFPISHHQKIKITNNSNDLLSFQSNNNQKKLASYNELLEDELESPFSTDGSLPSSFGAQVADEDGDINTHLSLMHSQNDGVEETLVMSPDSGRPDSPRIQKNSSLNSLKISHKRDIASPYSNISDDFKSEDDSSTAYYDVKTDEDDTTTYQDLSEISTELGDKFQKSNHSDFFESADSCKTSESSFDMCNDGDQETDRSSKPLKNTMTSEVHLKSRDTKSLPRAMTSSYMTESFQDNHLRSLNKYAIDTSLLKNVSEKILPTSNSSVNNKEKLILSKRLFSSTMKQERKNSNQTRSEEKPFRVEVLKGILGLGMTLTVDENGFVRVSEIKSQSTIGKNGNIKVGDYILSVNSTDLMNVTDSQVQQILRLLPRGLITVIASVLPITDWKSHIADSTFKSVPSSLPNSKIGPVIIPSSPKLVSVNSSFSENQPAIIHNTKNDTQNPVESSSKKPTNWNSETSDKRTSSSPLSATKKSDFTQKDAVEEVLCSRVVVTKDKHSIRNGRTSPRSLPLVDLSDFSTDNSKEKTPSVLTSSISHVAVEPIKDNHKKESYQFTVVSSDQLDSPSRSSAIQSSNIKQIPDKNETKMEWSTNLPPTLESMSLLTPTNSSLVSISTESHVAPIEFVQKEESVSSHSMPPSFSASKSKETETVSSQMVTPAVEQPISPRITSNRKLPDIFKSSHTNAPVVRQITSPSASEILFTDFAPGSPNVSPVIESVMDVQKSKHNFAEVPKAEIATSEPIVMQPKVSKDLPQSLVETSSVNSSQVTISKDDAVSQNKFQTPSTAKAETFPLKADKEIPEVERRRGSLKRETLESVTQVESSRKGTQKTAGDDLKDNLPSEEHKKLAVNIPKSPNKSEVIQGTNQSPQSTDGSSVVMLRRSRGRSQVSPRSELISEKSLVFHSDPTVSENSSKQMSIQRRKELAKTCIEPYMVFTKRKWCISTRFGQTNFALPSEPESSQDVLKLSLLDEDTVIDFVSKANFALDKLGLSNHYSIHICIVEKEASEKVGIRLQKGEKQELLISLLEPDGAAKRQQYICEGDLLLYMNGKPAWNQTVMDMKTFLQTTATRIVLLLARPFVGEDSETFEVILRKGVTGLGFSLGGGIGCPLGDRPISVKRIFKGGIADKCGEMRVGDEILEVNGEDFRNQRHFHAWNHLKFLPEGDLKLLICRHHNSEKVDPLPTRTRTARPGTASGESEPASATSTSTVTTTTSVEPRDPPSVTPVLPLVQLSPEKPSTGIAAAAAMIAMSTAGAIHNPHQPQKSTTTTTANTTITTTTTMQTQ